jgi:hypothetical protein
MREIVRIPATHAMPGGLLYAAIMDGMVDKRTHLNATLPRLYESSWGDAGTLNASSIRMAAQRYGEYVYGITRYADSYTSAQYGIRDNTGLYSELRFNDSTIFYDITAGAAGASNPVSSFDLSPVNSALHVSDHFPPRLWFISGTTVGYFIDNGKPWAWHSVSNPPLNPQGWVATHRYKYQFWHHYQDYEPQSDLLPTLAPIGEHGEPKLWWFVKTSDSNPDLFRFQIVEQSWEQGAYRHDRGYVTVADGLLLDPSTNSNDLAFGNPHSVGLVGPFPGMNADHQPVFKVLRDPVDSNKIWLVAISAVNVYAVVGWDGVWHCYSDDDGKTWSKPKVMFPAARSSAGFSISYGGATSVAITGSGHIVIPVSASKGGVTAEAFAYVNYQISQAHIDPGYGLPSPGMGVPGKGGGSPAWLDHANSKGGSPSVIFREA